jgi:hypothetical protein
MTAESNMAANQFLQLKISKMTSPQKTNFRNKKQPFQNGWIWTFLVKISIIH